MSYFSLAAATAVGRGSRPSHSRRRIDAGGLVRDVVVAVAVIAAVGPVAAHDAEISIPVVVDTDLGLDDAVALAMILQDPDLEVVAAIAGDGVADAETAADQLARLVATFNRPDVAVFASSLETTSPAPVFRARAGAAIDAALTTTATVDVSDLRPQSYLDVDHPATVLVLGPLTRLAGALSAAPEIASGIDRIVVSGDPEQVDDWNLAADAAAVETVRAAQVPIVFVRPGSEGFKPDEWYTTGLTGGQQTAIGEELLDRLLADPEVRAHYLGSLASFHDELAALFVVRPELFTTVGQGIVEPTDGDAAAAAIADALSRGRQRKDRVVFVDGPLPAEVLRDDVRARRDAMLAANGPDEWFAQLLLNELHEHLGAYSVIGVKMGLYAAELLNAPQHAMAIVSAAPAAQPLSCLNDGLLVATGSTPGRGLFSHVPGPPGTVEATFTYNGRSLTLRLKDEYKARIGAVIRALLASYTLEDDGYWEGVRELGLDIWQDWHRSQLFDVILTEPLPEEQTGVEPS